MRSNQSPPDQQERGPPDLLESLADARRFIDQVRLDHNKSNRRNLGGLSGLRVDQSDFIREAPVKSGLIAAVGEVTGLSDPLIRGFEAFEELCRRRGVDLPISLRLSVMRLLALEVLVNFNAINIKDKALVNFTIHQGAKALDLKQNPDFSSYPAYVFNMAVRRHTSNPERFLRQVNRIVDQVKKNPEFRNLSAYFVRSATHHAHDPEGYLRRMAGNQARSDDLVGQPLPDRELRHPRT